MIFEMVHSMARGYVLGGDVPLSCIYEICACELSISGLCEYNLEMRVEVYTRDIFIFKSRALLIVISLF